MSRPFFPRRNDSSSYTRVNGKIRAREVRVIDGANNQQLGIVAIGEALNLARVRGVDLVEISANANPPVCKLIDFGKYRYDQAKKEKESRKHQHANKIKEVQLSASIDPHDLKIKRDHAIEFLCEDMKVKISLRLRGRENAHPEVARQVVDKFVSELAPFAHPDFPPKLSGRMINAILSPLPRNKRAKNPNEPADHAEDHDEEHGHHEPPPHHDHDEPPQAQA